MTTSYRVFVCTKKRHLDDPEGSCYHCGASEIYEQFQAEIKQHGLEDRVEVKSSGCLDHCEAGPVVLICQPKSTQLSWLPLKARIKLRKLLFSHKYFYGGIQAHNVQSIVKSHLLQGKPFKKYLI